jgi:hypothetical protein
MGIGTCSAVFLGHAKLRGVDFSRTAMIGRQSFWPGADALGKVFSRLNIQQRPDVLIRDEKYAEPFLKLLGADVIASFDVSDYESATVVHDMNLPIPPQWRQRFSCVHDGGTTEHVFNIPQALRNCMEMVEVGGHFTQVNVANNCTGHGFWQFSPEMLYRVFSPENGFKVVSMLIHEVVPGGVWYAVGDPDRVADRITLCNRRPAYICTVAKRVKDVNIFSRYPAQGYYRGKWSAHQFVQEKERAGVRPAWRKLIPNWFKRFYAFAMERNSHRKAGYPRYRSGFRSPGYRRIKEAELLSEDGSGPVI